MPESKGEQRPLVVHVLQRLDYGGMETVLVHLINAVGQAPYRQAVICLDDYSDFSGRIRHADVPIHALHKRDGKDPSAYWRLGKLLRRLRPALVNTYNLSALDVAPLARLAGARVVHSEHGWQVANARDMQNKYLRLRRWMLPFIDRYVAVSQELQSWLVDTVRLPENRVTCIHNGIPLQECLGRESHGRNVRAELGIADQEFVIGTVARLDPIKAHDVLLRAFAEYLATAPARTPSRLVIVGDGPERARLNGLVRDLNIGQQVVMTGARSDIAAMLSSFDVFTLPSHNEGISIALLEAMAARLPVVATAVGGMPEVVSDGQTGMLVRCGDPASLVGGFARYASDKALRRRHGDAGWTRLRTHFSLEHMVSQYMALYSQILNASGAKVDRRGVG